MLRRQVSHSRRAFLGGTASLLGLCAAGCGETEPPTYGNLLRMGDLLTYKAHRLLLPEHSMAREYTLAELSPAPAIGTVNPADSGGHRFHEEHGPRYERLRAGGFADWALTVEGAVARPQAFSLAALERLPRRTQVTRITCEQGWTAIVEWTGVTLRGVLEATGMLPTARYVQFHAYDHTADGIDMLDALHPQTILAFGMNGRPLELSHGAPLRLRVETQLGYKSIKYLRRIVVTERFDDNGNDGDIRNGWSWYAGI